MTADQIADIKSALANADALDKQAQWTREQCRKICDHTNADGSSAVEMKGGHLAIVDGKELSTILWASCTICRKTGRDGL